MTDWKKTINFIPFWNNDDLSIQEKAKLAGTEIRRVIASEPGDDIHDVIEMFEEDVPQDEAPVQMFDAAMTELYDWADANSVWVATNF